MTRVMVSGGFDPLHVGHLNLIKAAAEFGEVDVVVMSDEWLIRKKGYCVMSQVDRVDIVGSLSHVSRVYYHSGEAEDISEDLRQYEPDMFCNGGDRYSANEHEHLACVQHGIVEAFNVGGGKIRSSSDLMRRPE